MICEEDLLANVDPKLRLHIFTKFKHYPHEKAEACFKELLKYLYLSSKYPVLAGCFIPVTQEIDYFWHEIILQTRLYQTLCSQLPGGKMIHHESLAFHDYQQQMDRQRLIDEVLRWLVLYVRNFGDMQENRLQYWYFLDVVKQTLNISLAELNAQAHNDTYFGIVEPPPKLSVSENVLG